MTRPRRTRLERKLARLDRIVRLQRALEREVDPLRALLLMRRLFAALRSRP